ncbi:MAG: hypothetical protein ACR2P4_00775 [Gammaproteobacteria bacterium]
MIDGRDAVVAPAPVIPAPISVIPPGMFLPHPPMTTTPSID